MDHGAKHGDRRYEHDRDRKIISIKSGRCISYGVAYEYVKVDLMKLSICQRLGRLYLKQVYLYLRGGGLEYHPQYTRLWGSISSVISSLVYRESSALYHATTEAVLHDDGRFLPKHAWQTPVPLDLQLSPGQVLPPVRLGHQDMWVRRRDTNPALSFIAEPASVAAWSKIGFANSWPVATDK
ncbi:unnamed protein product [Timema podura]|uniref:Uncharacterized protein n=1 Tax=Timema podura TaxID=61482 RepID=A0ABN7NS26_TIMPD|nr:unnamed protein product [Timema podura]